MQPVFFIQQSAFKGLESDSWILVNSIGGARWHTPHMLSCSLAQMIGSLEIYFRVFFHRGTCISDVHTGAYPISVLWSEMDDFFMNE